MANCYGIFWKWVNRENALNKDWVVWCGCALLFCAGAVWGGGKIEIEFFKVANIHDLFEIFSSAATVAAVFLAFAGVNAWRKQISAQSDHALAHRVAVAALKYKETTCSAFDDALFSVTQFHFGVEELPDGFLDRYIENMEDRLLRNNVVKSEFLAVLLDARAVWGIGFHNKYLDLLDFTEDFCQCVRIFVEWGSFDRDESDHDRYAKLLQRHYDKFEAKNWLTISSIQLLKVLDRLTLAADDELAGKLIRFN
jgi:hypothetical protein